jgi:transcriptional regulator with XRE-family HTH domain
MSLSERIQELRKKNEDSQEQLADKLGVSRQAVSKWENGQGSPDVNNVLKISEIYNVSTDYVLKGSVEQPVNREKPRKPMDATVKKALSIILVVAGIAVVTIIFISGLYFLARYVMAPGF